MKTTIERLLSMMAANDPYVHDLRMHPSDWDRSIDAQGKLRERRPEIARAFDSAIVQVGRDRDAVADRLAYVAAAALNAGTQLGLDMAGQLAWCADLNDDEPDLVAEVADVLETLDGLAHQMGDEGVFRRCRDRLRAAIGHGQNDPQP